MMNSEIKELYDLFKIEIIENILTEMKESEMNDLFYVEGSLFKRLDLEHYLDLRRGFMCA